MEAHETPRQGFLGKAAGAAAVSAAFLGGAELAGASPAIAQTTTVPGFYDVTDFGALGNGSHDDTPAIKDAIKAAAANAYGGVVFLPIGQHLVTSPLVLTSGDIPILGAGPLATMGGAGYDDGKCTTIKPAADWAQGSATQPACILFDAVTARKDLNHGIATYGYVGALSVTGCSVGSIAHSASAGIVTLASDSKAAQAVRSSATWSRTSAATATTTPRLTTSL